MESTGLALQVYRHHYGAIPVRITGDFGSLDVEAALTADKKSLTIGESRFLITNLSPEIKGVFLTSNSSLSPRVVMCLVAVFLGCAPLLLAQVYHAISD